jgi:hypothetical protein
MPLFALSFSLCYSCTYQFERMRLYRFTLLVQTVYYFITAIWPIIDIESFMKVSGPKTDTWLVKTVGALLLAMVLSFVSALFQKNAHWPTVILAAASCVALAFIDCYYVFNGTIWKVYLGDAVVEIVLLILWLLIIVRLWLGRSLT